MNVNDSRRTFDSVYNDEAVRRARVKEMMGLTPEERHRKFLADYDRYYGGGASAAAARAQVISRPTSSDAQVIRDTFRFIRSEKDDADQSWEARVARRYYSKLFKEYCISDLSRYKEQKIGLRWRVEKEVVVGKGQFSCGSKRCEARDDLTSYEVHFGYQEAGERKEALVKLRVCESCAYKLNYGRSTALRKVSKGAAPGQKNKRRTGEKGDCEGGNESVKRRRRSEGTNKRRGDESESKNENDDDDEEEEEEDDDEEEEEDDDDIGPTGEAGEDVWLGKADTVDAQPTKEEEYDQYFTDMFM